MAVYGGQNLKRILRSAGKGGIKAIDVGFYSTAKYPDGTLIPAVAAYNEFGTSRMPSRPFMRNANSRLKKELPGFIKQLVDPRKLIIDERIAGLVGERIKDEIQAEITDLKQPPNAPSTIEAKGSSNPLIDTAKMRRSVTYKIVR